MNGIAYFWFGQIFGWSIAAAAYLTACFIIKKQQEREHFKSYVRKNFTIVKLACLESQCKHNDKIFKEYLRQASASDLQETLSVMSAQEDERKIKAIKKALKNKLKNGGKQ